MLKRKLIMEEIDLFKKKKKQFEIDVEGFIKIVDEFVDKVENL